MFLAKRIRWAGIAFTFLATGMVTGLPRSAAGSDFKKEGVAAFIIENEITKMQETLRDKGHYRGKVDGVFGLRTRASIRAYQKAENLPVTGQVDTRTADGLGVRPEGQVETGNETTKGKPSAGIKWAKGSGRTSKTLRKTVKTTTATESGQGEDEKALQAENSNHPQ